MAQRTTNHTPDIDSGSWISNIFSYFGGAYLPALKETPSDRSKFVTIGLFVFNTALLAFITMSFALHSVFRSNEEGWLIWVVAGFWAIVIFSIDWGLVKTMKKVPNASWAEFKTYTGIVIPTILRIIVATIISFTISCMVFKLLC